MVCLGYYIKEKNTKPDWCNIDSEHILSLDEEFGDLHPDLTRCYFTNYSENHRKEYAKFLNLSEDGYKRFCETIHDMIQTKKLSPSGKLLDYEDAVKMYSYFKDYENIKLISICTSEKYVEILNLDSAEISEFNDIGIFSGYEILGTEYMGRGYFNFESYLVSDFQEELAKHYDLKISRDNGLIQNSFEETDKFAEFIHNADSLFYWIPYSIYEYNVGYTNKEMNT